MFSGRPILLVTTFVLTLGAGVSASKLASRLPRPAAAVTAGPHSPLGDQLHLSADQSEKMRVIWEGTRGTLDDCFAHGQTLQEERDDAVVALLTPDQKKDYAKINETYVEKFADLSAQRKVAFDLAVHRTEAILTDAQKAKYQEILKSRVGHANPFGPDARMAAGQEAPSNRPQ